MTSYILDTDHFSLWQRNHPLVVARVKAKANHIVITIITAEELLQGRFNVIRQSSQASQIDKLVFAYNLFWETLEDLKTINILKFDQEAYTLYKELRQQKIRIGTQDLKIATIALATQSILVTRNARDFAKIPHLNFEDWTILS